jgi:uncharacterized iron-regulated membrane protein
MRLSTPFFRQVHKWIGLVLGLQFVLWTLSGAMMATLDQQSVAGGGVREMEARALPAAASGWPRIRVALAGQPITAMTLGPLLDRHVVEISTSRGSRLFDAVSGAPIVVDAALAGRAAQQAYAANGTIRSIRRLKALELAVREQALPIWRVDFADEQNSSYYVSGGTGRVLERRNDAWRMFDFFWMVHNMDYLNRTSFNHPLIVVVGFGVLWLAVTGFYLLFRTGWRSDLRWLRRKDRSASGPST